MVTRLSIRTRNDSGDVSDVIGRIVQNDPLILERRDGSRVQVPAASIIASRQVSARPLRTREAMAWSANELLAICARGWPAVESQPCGDWELRASDGWTKRANSAVAAGEPESLAAVEEFYRARGLPPLVQVVAGSTWDERLRKLHWQQVGPITKVLVKDLTPSDGPQLASRADEEWLTLFGRSDDLAVSVLEGTAERGPTCGFVRREQHAIARAVVTGEWAGISSLWVAAEHRRKKVATNILLDCEAWASQIADKVYVQVVNTGIEGLYASYTRHHDYVYLTPST